MFIKKFKYKDHVTGWELEETEFEEITLLVGASGVGKTKILEALYRLNGIANGKSFNGIEWDIEVMDINKNIYRWKGQFMVDTDPKKVLNKNFQKEDKVEIQYEEIYNGEQIIAIRNSEGIQFLGNPTLKLSNTESLISLLKEQSEIKPLFELLDKIQLDRYQHSAILHQMQLLMAINNGFDFVNSINTIEDIRNAKYHVFVKLFAVEMKFRSVFELIEQRFIEIFPSVENIRIAPIEKPQPNSVVFANFPIIQIKESGVDGWISTDSISSGMLRTLIHLAEISLCPDGTIFLIDEFENSLGVNCAQQVMDEILAAGRKIQFIITSHHPYVINNIDFKYWKIVTRKGSLVKTHKASEFPLGNSRHSAFMQLLQLDEYLTGQESPL